MTAKQYLKQTDKLTELINSNKLTLQKLRDLSVSLTSNISIDKVQTTHHVDKTSADIAKIIDLEQKIDYETHELIKLKCEIWETISKIDDREYRIILQNKYLNDMSWDEIANDINYNIRHVHRLHGKALLAIAEIIKNKDVTKCH